MWKKDLTKERLAGMVVALGTATTAVLVLVWFGIWAVPLALSLVWGLVLGMYGFRRCKYCQKRRCDAGCIGRLDLDPAERSIKMESQTGLVFNDAGWMWPGYWRTLTFEEVLRARMVHRAGGYIHDWVRLGVDDVYRLGVDDVYPLCPEGSDGTPAYVRPGVAEIPSLGWRSLSDTEILAQRKENQ